jgi:hypothetical protein
MIELEYRMKTRRDVIRNGWRILLGILTLSGIGCRPPRPKVICEMKNPLTGLTVKMYKEDPLKVPPNYDEKQHIEQWKAEQAQLGYTVEVK